MSTEQKANIAKYWLACGKLKTKTERYFNITRSQLMEALKENGYA